MVPQAQCQALVPLLVSLYKQGQRGTERVMNLPKVTQLVDGAARFSPRLAIL